jgi:mercuric ion transport protein
MFWQKIRSGVMFVVAFVSCPCHLPITLPLILVLLAGTPAALWISQHVGWVYGILAGVFLLSLGLGFVWIDSNKENEVCEPRLTRPINRTTTEGVKHE